MINKVFATFIDGVYSGQPVQVESVDDSTRSTATTPVILVSSMARHGIRNEEDNMRGERKERYDSSGVR